MRGIFSIIIAGIALGSIGYFVKIIDNEIHFLTLNFLRITLGFLFLLLIVPIIDKKTFKIKKEDLKTYILIGFLFFLSISLYTTSLKYTTIQSAVMILFTHPAFIIIFAYLILREKVSKHEIISLIISLIGIYLINPLSGHIIGNSLALLSAISYSLLIVMIRKDGKKHGVGSVMWFLGFAAIFSLPFGLIGGFEGLSSKNIMPIINLGIISTGILYFFYYLGLKEIKTETAAITTMIIAPIISILFAVIGIGEKIETNVIYGGTFLILGGVYLNSYKEINRIIKKIKNN